MDEKHSMCFQKETSVKFLRRSVDVALLVNERKASKAIAPVVPHFRSPAVPKSSDNESYCSRSPALPQCKKKKWISNGCRIEGLF